MSLPALTPTTVECFGLRLDHDGHLAGRLVRRPLAGDPDHAASAAIGLAGTDLDGVAVLHSTSWRWDPDEGIVLTYVCAPDPVDVGGDGVVIRTAHDHRHEAPDPSRPGDGSPTMAHVLHHGIDHLAWLADHHTHLIERSQAVAPALWIELLGAGRHRAGRLPESVERPAAG